MILDGFPNCMLVLVALHRALLVAGRRGVYTRTACAGGNMRKVQNVQDDVNFSDTRSLGGFAVTVTRTVLFEPGQARGEATE